MESMTTTNNLFTTIDISHKPKRMQGDSFKNTPLALEKELSNKTSSEEKTEAIPEFLTLEKAIAYFESKSDSITNEGKFYTATAKWLRELLEFRANKVVATNTLVTSLKEDTEEKGDE